MAYEIISQNNNTTTLSDGTNTITVPARVTLATSTSYTISEVNNNTATLEGSDGSVIRDVPCVVVLAGEGGGGSDQHNLGYYADLTALQTAYPTGTDGDFAILGSTDTIWVWDSGTSAWKDTDTKGQVTSVNGQTGAVTVDTLPTQTGQSGKFLTTDGTDASWSDKPLVNTATGANSLTILGAPAIKSGCINIGPNSSVGSSTGVVAIGADTKGNTKNAIAIGNGAQVSSLVSGTGGYGIAIGSGAKTTGNVDVSIGMGAGRNSSTNHCKTCIGYEAAATAHGAYQFGRGTNSEAGTVCFSLNTTGGTSASDWHNYKLLDSDGTIPTDRYTTTPVADGTYVPTLTISSGVATRSWAAPGGGGSSLPDQTGHSGEFLTTDGTDASWATINALQNTASGTNALTLLGTATTQSYSINIGGNSVATGSGVTSVGCYASCTSSDACAYGNSSSASGNYAIAVGYNARATKANSICIGAFASSCTAANSVLLGVGENNEAGTFCWGTYVNNTRTTYKLVDNDGTIPTDRFTTTPVADGTYVPTLTISSGTATRTWGAAASAPVVPATMPTLAVADWSSNTQTITVTGVTASNVVIVAPAPASAADYAAAGIVCTAQGSGTLTFTCTTVPSNAITVNVVILG